jgi:hypothetical protein
MEITITFNPESTKESMLEAIDRLKELLSNGSDSNLVFGTLGTYVSDYMCSYVDGKIDVLQPGKHRFIDNGYSIKISK